MPFEAIESNRGLSNSPEPEATTGPSYVVHGAKTYCSMGTSEARLIVPLSHGVYVHKKAQLNKGDCLSIININSMGVCRCSGSSEQIVKPADLTSDIQTIFEADAIKVAKVSIATCQACIPVINMEWQNTKKSTLIEEKEALLNCSVIQCIRGGTIIITNDGQLDDLAGM